LALAAAGVHVCLIGRRLERLETVAATARGLGAKAKCYAADLASESGQSGLARRLTDDLPRIDLLVHSAAMFASGAIDRSSAEVLDEHFKTNVRAPYILTQALLPRLKESRGQIVFINSSSGVKAKPFSAQYDATKHALRAIADSLREEVNAGGVRVLSIYLGRTASDIQARIHGDAGKPYRPDLLLQPQDVASIILSALTLPRTAEVTDIHIRPMIRS
jgi:NADP-dependent 3-hydroxy acid dehydrogenase YdfG